MNGNHIKWLWLPRLLIAGIFIFAGVIKVIQPDTFFEDVLNYQLLPRSAAWLIAFYLPMLEMVVGIALLFRPTCRASAWILLLCMILFTTALAFAWVRGLNIECGCFGGLIPASHYGWLLTRNLLLISLLGWIILVYPKHDT
jgi:uncharacterized membrane protein YphA (DoxX/SURF4 family)